jgi:hypothetical protein
MNLNLTTKQVIRLTEDSKVAARDYRRAISMSTDKKVIADFTISLRETEEIISTLELALIF